MTDLKQNFFLKQRDLIGNKEIQMEVDDEKFIVIIENSKVISVNASNEVDGENAGLKFDLHDINSQLQSGASLGQAVFGGQETQPIDETRNKFEKLRGYIVTTHPRSDTKSKILGYYTFKKYPSDHEALEAAYAHAKKVAGVVKEVLTGSLGPQLYAGNTIWKNEGDSLNESKLKSLIRECISEVMSELR